MCCREWALTGMPCVRLSVVRCVAQPFDDIVEIAMFALQRVKAGVKLLLFLDFGVTHRNGFPL